MALPVDPAGAILLSIDSHRHAIHRSHAVGIVLILLGYVIAYGELGHALPGCFGCWVALGVCAVVVIGGGLLVFRRRSEPFGEGERPR